MKALKIHLFRERNYHRFEKDREYFRHGETVFGYAMFDTAGQNPPASTRFVWTDTFGRRVRTFAGKWNKRLERLEFELELCSPVSMSNHIEVVINGVSSGREPFTVARPYSVWRDFPILVWAHYPDGCYDELRAMGINGIIAYKRDPAQHILDNNFICYVDQVSPEEMSVYHRPYSQYYEKPENATHPERKAKWFLEHWDMVRQRYKRARERLEGRPVSLDAEGRKTLWRANCPSDPANLDKMRERIVTTVAQHKALRPLFYNLCDEPGTGDQAAPFDFCFCAHCLNRFRPWLEKRYGSLDRLNKQWGTGFKRWFNVVPFTADDIINREKKRRAFNFSPWADHREFMDELMNTTYGKMREFGKSADPNALYGTTGGQAPGAYGGWDYAKLVENVDLHIPYNLCQNDDMIRSFRPRALKMAPYFGNRRTMVRNIWYQAFHGDCGQLHWDNHEKGGTFLAIAGRKWTAKARRLAPSLIDLSRGIGRQLLAMTPEEPRLAIHHSQASVRAHWMMGALNEGHSWVDRDSCDCINAAGDKLYALRDSFARLSADSAVPAAFISYRELENNELNIAQRRILVLPHSMALSEAECRAVRAFAERGGVVVADALPGVMDEHCSLLTRGRLDSFFGVWRKGFEYDRNCPEVVVSAENPFGLTRGKKAYHACERSLRAINGSIAYAKAGKADCLVVNRVGNGLAVYLNVDFRQYGIWRYRVNSRFSDDPLSLFESCLELAGVRKAHHFLNRKTGKRARGLDISRFIDCGVELMGVTVNSMRRTTGVGDELKVGFDAFDKPQPLRVTLDRGAHVYETRSGRYFGHINEFNDRFDPFDAKIYALVSYRVTGINAVPQDSCRTGVRTRFKLKLCADSPVSGRHVLRVDVFDPKGLWLPHYSENVELSCGEAEWALPLAENDPVGKWMLEFRDAVSGYRDRAAFTVAD